jgi:hypothetical protein
MARRVLVARPTKETTDMDLTRKTLPFAVLAAAGALFLSTAGCAVQADPEALGEAQEAAQTGTYGNATTGTKDGPGDTGTTAVNKVIAYNHDDTGSYVAGVDLYYTDGTHHLFGYTSNYSNQFTFSGGVIDGVHVHVESGVLRGIKFRSNLDTSFIVGFFNGEETVFQDPSYTLTDMVTWSGNNHGNNIIWGASFLYNP